MKQIPKMWRIRKMVYKRKAISITRKKLTTIVLFVTLAISIPSIFGVRTAKAAPSVPSTIPNGNPVNMVWYNNAPPSLVTGEMLDELGWVWGDQLDSHDAHAMLMIQDGLAARWYIWIYKGGWDPNWGYWSYAGVSHYYFDPNPFHFGWYLDNLEGPETKLRNQWATSVTPWTVTINSYWLGNNGYYSGEYNNGYATRIYIPKDEHELTVNSNFVKSQDKWDGCLYWFNWLPPFNDGDCTDSNGDGRSDSDPNNHYVLWPSDGVVHIKSRDQNIDSAGMSARFGQGKFHGDPSRPLAVRLDSAIKTLTMEAQVANWGCTYTLFPDWCGIKFDAMIRNVYTGNRLMVEMYWLGYGVNDLGRGDIFRKLNNLYDYIVEIPHHPESVTEINWATNRKTYIINLLKLFKYAVESLIPVYDIVEGGGDPRNWVLGNWELYHVAVDVETCDIFPWSDIRCWVDAEMLKVTCHGNHSPETPSTPSGATSGYKGKVYSYATSAIDLDSDDIRYQFDWGDGTTTTTGWYASGATASASHSWSSTRTYYVKVRAQDTYGVWSAWSSSRAVNIKSGGGGGGGCPMLFVWNGADYVCEGLLDIHNLDGVDMIATHTLASTPQAVHSAYRFKLIEHPNTHSYIDQVKLYAILEDETTVQLPLIHAWHSECGNVLPRLLFSDDWKTDTLGANLNSGISQAIELKFAALPPNMKATAFRFYIEGNNMLPK